MSWCMQLSASVRSTQASGYQEEVAS